VELAQTCYWHEESKSMRSNKEQMWDNLMNWDTEFQVQIENMENMGNMPTVPQGAAAQNLVGSVDSMSFMDRHASAVSNNPRSMEASANPTPSKHRLFPNATLPPHMNPKSQPQARSNVYQAVSAQTRDPPMPSDMSIAASTAMETFQSDIDDVKEDVQELKEGVKSIQELLKQLLVPTSAVKTTVSTEPSGMTSSTGGTYGSAGQY